MPLVQETVLQRIGKTLHLYIDDTTREPLPRRWVDLIHDLNEEEQKHSLRKPEAEEHVVGAQKEN